MKTTFISTNGMSAATRSSLLKVQQDLANAQKEMISGRYADVGKTLGYRTGNSISLRQEFTRLSTIVDTNAVVSTRLDVTQTKLQDLVDSAQSFIDQVLASTIGSANALVAKTDAKSRLEGLVDTLNTTFGGSYIFAGVNSDVKPLNEYYGTPATASQQGVAAAFLADFTIAQSDPNVANISATDIQTFLDTTFASLFDDPSWSTDWSSASSQNSKNRISTSELVETSTNATETAFRKLAQAFTMVADLGIENMSQPAFEAVLNQAVVVATSAIKDLSDLQSELGVTQQRVADSSQRIKLQMDILETRVGKLEGVDPNEAATRVEELATQVDTAYALTARILSLSLLNYL